MWVSKQRVCQTEKTEVQRPWGMGKVGKFQEQGGEARAARARAGKIWGRGRQIIWPMVKFQVTFWEWPEATGRLWAGEQNDLTRGSEAPPGCWVEKTKEGNGGSKCFALNLIPGLKGERAPGAGEGRVESTEEELVRDKVGAKFSFPSGHSGCASWVQGKHLLISSVCLWLLAPPSPGLCGLSEWLQLSESQFSHLLKG